MEYVLGRSIFTGRVWQLTLLLRNIQDICFLWLLGFCASGVESLSSRSWTNDVEIEAFVY